MNIEHKVEIAKTILAFFEDIVRYGESKLCIVNEGARVSSREVDPLSSCTLFSTSDKQKAAYEKFLKDNPDIKKLRDEIKNTLEHNLVKL